MSMKPEAVANMQRYSGWRDGEWLSVRIFLYDVSKKLVFLRSEYYGNGKIWQVTR